MPKNVLEPLAFIATRLQPLNVHDPETHLTAKRNDRRPSEKAHDQR